MNEPPVPQPGILQEHPTLSVCLIVRDEEKVLRRCLKSVQSIADEFVVVDTGSKDNTISMARDFGAKVFHFEWRDDFSAARNECLKYAASDWILQIDADEELASDSKQALKDHMFESTILCYMIKCDNGPNYEGPRFHWFGRLFRNHPLLRYSRPFHESIEPSLNDLVSKEPRWQIKYESTILIRHHGYESSGMTQKWNRGVRIMKSYLNENPDDAYMLTKLGGFCGNLGRYDEAEAYLNKAVAINPNWSETHYSLGVILQKQNKLEAAADCYEKAIDADPNFSEAYANLGVIYAQKGMLDTAISTLKRGVVVNPNDGQIHFLLAFTYYGNTRYGLSIQHCDRAVKLGYRVPPWFLEWLNAHR